VSTDTGTTVLGRRDILITWRGTEGLVEGIIDLDAFLTSASEILGKEHDPKVHLGPSQSSSPLRALHLDSIYVTHDISVLFFFDE
jgi:hypothetical protein